MKVGIGVLEIRDLEIHNMNFSESFKHSGYLCQFSNDTKYVVGAGALYFNPYSLNAIRFQIFSVRDNVVSGTH